MPTTGKVASSAQKVCEIAVKIAPLNWFAAPRGPDGGL